jgi:hypothetical protein
MCFNNTTAGWMQFSTLLLSDVAYLIRSARATRTSIYSNLLYDWLDDPETFGASGGALAAAFALGCCCYCQTGPPECSYLASGCDIHPLLEQHIG